MICSKCGYENQGDGRFCGKCGALLAETPQTNEAAPVQPQQEDSIPVQPQQETAVPVQPQQEASIPVQPQQEASSPVQPQQVTPPPVAPQMYQQPNFYEAQPPKKASSVLSIIGLIVAIVALVGSVVVLGGWLLGIAALVICIIALVTKKGSKGLNLAGVIIAGVAILISSILFVLALVRSTNLMGPLFDERTNSHNDIPEINRGVEDDPDETVSSTYTVSNELGTFTLPSTWVIDNVNSTPDEYTYVYAPNTASSYEASDYLYIVGAQTPCTYDDRDYLIQLNKEDITSSYSDVTADDIDVYILPEDTTFDAPMIAYNFQSYNDEVGSMVEVWEYHLIYDYSIVMFISYNLDGWTDVSGNPRDIVYNAVESFVMY